HRLRPGEHEVVRLHPSRETWKVQCKKRRSDTRNQKAQESRDSRCDRSHGSRTTHDRMHPPKDESPGWAKATPKISVLAACFGDCGAKLSEGKCAENRENCADDPCR